MARSELDMGHKSNLNDRLVGAALELGRRRNPVDHLQQAANSPCGFYHRVFIRLAQQHEGVKNFGITGTIGCLIRIIDMQVLKKSMSAVRDLIRFSRKDQLRSTMPCLPALLRAENSHQRKSR